MNGALDLVREFARGGMGETSGKVFRRLVDGPAELQRRPEVSVPLRREDALP